MKIAIVTDAWLPQVNGVVRTYEHTTAELKAMGHDVEMVTPDGFRTVPCPTYSSIRLAINPLGRVRALLAAGDFDAIHIATEGPLGHAARHFCLGRGVPFTTAFHTRFPEYIRMRVPIPVNWSYAYLRRFHAPAVRTLVPTESQQEQLLARRFNHVVTWTRGVDTKLFRPRGDTIPDVPRPVFIYMGRVATEKNIEAFLKLELPGGKVIVGDGPDRERLQRRYPEVYFAGFRFGEELVHYLAAADVFVFPSLTDTFGIVLLEAMACGLPVAAFPVTGPKDIVREGETGILDWDLRRAALAALKIDRSACVAWAAGFSWRKCAASFAGQLAPIKLSGAGTARHTASAA